MIIRRRRRTVKEEERVRQKKLQLAACVQEKFPGPFISRHLFRSGECVLRRIVRPERIHCLSTYCVMIDAGWLAFKSSSHFRIHLLLCSLEGQTWYYSIKMLLAFESRFLLSKLAGQLVSTFKFLSWPTEQILKRCLNKFSAFYWNSSCLLT